MTCNECGNEITEGTMYESEKGTVYVCEDCVKYFVENEMSDRCYSADAEMEDVESSTVKAVRAEVGTWRNSVGEESQENKKYMQKGGMGI